MYIPILTNESDVNYNACCKETKILYIIVLYLLINIVNENSVYNCCPISTNIVNETKDSNVRLKFLPGTGVNVNTGDIDPVTKYVLQCKHPVVTCP